VFSSGIVDWIFCNIDDRCIVGFELHRNNLTELRETELRKTVDVLP